MPPAAGRDAEVLLPRRCLSLEFLSPRGERETLAPGRKHSRPNSTGTAGNERPNWVLSGFGSCRREVGQGRAYRRGLMRGDPGNGPREARD